MSPVTKPQQCVSAASLTSNFDAGTVNITRFPVQIPDGDHTRPLSVCRVCLAVSVKMYHMLEHRLSVMYELVTGIEVNSEDRLPKVLCWECVARLSSANNFIQKALKTNRILLRKDYGGKITMSDIESIDRALHQLESTLGFKYYEANNTDLHIQSECDITSDDYDVTNIELPKSEHNKENEPFTTVGKVLDIMEQQKDAENFSDERMTIDISDVRAMSEKEFVLLDKERDVSQAIKEKQKHLSVTPINNQTEGLFFTKEVRVILEDVMLNFKNQTTQGSYKALSTKYKDNVIQPQIKKPIYKLKDRNNSIEILTNIIDTNDTDTNKSEKNIHHTENLFLGDSKNTGKTVSAISGTGNSNIDFIYHDVESSKKLFICDICNKLYKKKVCLIRHIQGHLNLHNCIYCSYKTNFKSSLNRHVNTKHTKITFYKCSYCDYKTYIQSSLIKHINRIHTKKTVYNCSYCNYKAYDKSNINIHVNAKHTNNTVYNCSYCTYKTYGKSNLNYHVNAKHTNSTVYDCSYCTYKAYNKNLFNAHVNTEHTNNIVYSCSYCSYKTCYKSSFNRHVKAKHIQGKSNVTNKA